MAITVPIISEFRDAGLKKAEAEIQGFGKRAGAALRNLSTGQVAAAGAAIGAFGVKAVMAFQNVALEAGKFADATGIASEDASRLIEVAGDLGIQSGAVQSAIQRMNKTIGDGSPIIKQLGIDIATAADGTVDANKTFQNAITTIGGIEDPTLRAAAAQQVFGKGYAEIAELMTMSAGELSTALGNVSDQKVITDAEVKQARAFRAAMDSLKDSAEDLTIEIGQALVPALGDLARGVEEVKVAGVGIGDALGSGFDAFLRTVGLDGVRTVGEFKNLQDQINESLRMGGLTAEQSAEYTDYYASRLIAAKEPANNLELALRGVEEATKDLRGEISQRQAFEKFDEIMWYIGANLHLSQEEADGFALAILDVVENLNDVPAETEARIVAAVELGDFRTVQAIINDLRRGASVPIRPAPTNVGLPIPTQYFEPRALGGPVSAGTPYMIGERGPELFVPAQSGHIVPNHGLPSGNTVININTSADPNEVVRALEIYRRRNGSLPL